MVDRTAEQFVACSDRFDHRRGRRQSRLAPGGSATSGVDWGQAIGVFKALLFSPLIGFVLSALLFLAMKYTIRVPKLYTSPEGRLPPPWPIRALLVLTCTGDAGEHHAGLLGYCPGGAA